MNTASSSQTHADGLTILVVDDSEEIRARLVRMIQQIEGASLIAQAVSVPKAIECFDNLHPQVVFLDIRLQDENGLDVLKHIKTQDPATKVILLTNYPYLQYRMTAQRLGADFFFNKSTEFDQALNALKTLIIPAAKKEDDKGGC